MKTVNEILEMTHAELMNSSDEVRQMYRKASDLRFFNDVKKGIDLGYKHIQMSYGCIKVKNNKNGIYYTTRNGRGTGKDTGQYLCLEDCIKSIANYGWGKEVTYK